jgi:hypothetical protein
MRFLNKHTRILHGRHPIDMNDRIGERTAAELALPDNFSDKAKACWEYYKGAAYIFEYKGRLVITDESLYLTDHGDGSHSAPFGGPRWVCDSWEDVKRNLEQNYDEVADPELNSGIEPTADERHIMRLHANGVIIRYPNGKSEPVTMQFYYDTIRFLAEDGNAVTTYPIELPGIPGDFTLAIWRNGHADCGSTERIMSIIDR